MQAKFPRLTQDDVQFGQALLNNLTDGTVTGTSELRRSSSCQTRQVDERLRGVDLFKVYIRESVLDINDSADVLEMSIIQLLKKVKS